MSTWTFDRSALCLCVGLLLASCTEGSGGLFAASSVDGTNSRRNVALATAELAGGALNLVPPPGYCVDKSTLRSSFAVVARCDSLGAGKSTDGASLGMILVSVTTPPQSEVDLGSALGSIVTRDTEVVEMRANENFALVHLRGSAPEGADSRYWRALARIGPVLLGATAYAPVGGRLSGAAGGKVLGQMIRRTTDASGTDDTEEAETGKSDGIRTILSGLFD